jgi:hypothetical protein
VVGAARARLKPDEHPAGAELVTARAPPAHAWMGLRRYGSRPDETDSTAVYRPGPSDTYRLGVAASLPSDPEW